MTDLRRLQEALKNADIMSIAQELDMDEISSPSIDKTEFPNFGKDMEIPRTKPPKNWKAYDEPQEEK